MDPLRDYYDGLRDAPVPARLMAETPPEAFARRLFANLAWATAALALVLTVASLPAAPDAVAASQTARAVAMREELLQEARP